MVDMECQPSPPYIECHGAYKREVDETTKLKTVNLDSVDDILMNHMKDIATRGNKKHKRFNIPTLNGMMLVNITLTWMKPTTLTTMMKTTFTVKIRIS